ncbi:MAG: hypothetical protein ACI9TY_001422 [Alphaproteobacteria bacterium]|jgi:hypothetical protein
MKKTTSFTQGQQIILKDILKNINKSALFKHLNIQHLLYESQWSILYDDFVENVPVGNIMSYLNMLRAITGDIRASDVSVLSYPQIICNKSDLRVAIHQDTAFPASKDMLVNSFMIEEKLAKGEIAGLEKVRGKIFHVFDDVKFGTQSDMVVGSFHLIRQGFASRKIKKMMEPKLSKFNAIGNSNYQKVHAFLNSLEDLGDKVEVLFVRPQILSEMSLILAQREGHFIPLRKICPNIKVIAHYGENIAPYKQSISTFLEGMACKQMEILAHPSGLMAYQANLYEKGLLTLSDREGVFYEFIPVEDLKSNGTLKRHFRRKYAGQVKADKEYVVAISNKSGLLGFNTEIIIKVHSIEPFVFVYKGHTMNLDYFSEHINPHLMEKLIESINKTLVNYNFHIREYLIGDHVENGKSYWLFELNTDLKYTRDEYLQSAANTIHNEMSLQNNNYRQTIMDGTMEPPEIYFLPVGSISNVINNIHMTHVDFDEEVTTIMSILNNSAEKKAFTPNSL